jgi:CRP-like cAMP-binding protein
MVLDQLRKAFSYVAPERWDDYLSRFRRMEVPARTILLREGEVSRKAYLIEQGCLRVWFDNNGEDTTFQFFFEGQGLSSIESYRKGIPSFFTIETLEPCVLYRIDKEDLDVVMAELKSLPGYSDQLLDFIMERQFHYMQQFLSFIKETPTERYLKLVAERPELLQRVPQRYIASYLGITPVSLSRIRNKLLRSGK